MSCFALGLQPLETPWGILICEMEIRSNTVVQKHSWWHYIIVMNLIWGTIYLSLHDFYSTLTLCKRLWKDADQTQYPPVLVLLKCEHLNTSNLLPIPPSVHAVHLQCVHDIHVCCPVTNAWEIIRGSLCDIIGKNTVIRIRVVWVSCW